MTENTTPNTTASGAADITPAAITQEADAALRALADRIEEAQGRAICISVEGADYLREALAASAPVAPAVGNSGFDYKTAADLLNGKTVRDEAIRKFVAASRWAHDDSAGLRATLISARGELASREAEIALLKKTLMDAELAAQPAAPQGGGDMLRAHAEGRVAHINNGLCPDIIEGHDTRDPECPVCQALLENHAALAAAPKAAPAINKVSDIIDAYGMTPGQPERVADIPGLAEALEAAFADGSAQVTGALQQGEYLPLPEPDTHCYDDDTGMDVWSYSASQMFAHLDAGRAARGAAQAAPASPYHDGVNIESLQRACRAFGLRTDDSLEAFVSPDVHAEHVNRLTRAVIKYVLTRPAQPAAPQGDGVPTWQAAQDPMLECSIQPRPLSHPLAAYHSAMSKGPLHYTWQDKPHRLVYDLIAAVKHYANQAIDAARAQAAQPEGGANANR